MKLSDIICHNRDRLTVPIVDITSVASYWSSLVVDQTVDPRTLPSVAPPFPDCLLDVDAGKLRFAIRIEAGKRPPDRRHDPLFMCLATGFVADGVRSARKMFTAPYVTDEGGKLADLGITVQPGFTLLAASVHLYVALLGISFMHCRNVTQEEVNPPEQIAKKQLRKHGIPKLSYRVLRIEPMTRVLRERGHSDTQGLPHALHICRGHFKTYTDEGPLFGKQVGTWWWDTNLRGARSAGTVVKDYAIGGT